MNVTLHITNGFAAGTLLETSKINREIRIQNDLLYDGLRNPGWPTESTLSNLIETNSSDGLSFDIEVDE